jgi:hypothetical protein
MGVLQGDPLSDHTLDFYLVCTPHGYEGTTLSYLPLLVQLPAMVGTSAFKASPNNLTISAALSLARGASPAV